jgi:hypothetical protein
MMNKDYLSIRREMKYKSNNSFLGSPLHFAPPLHLNPIPFGLRIQGKIGIRIKKENPKM